MDVARRREMDRLEIYLEVNLKGLGIDPLRKMGKKNRVSRIMCRLFCLGHWTVGTTH